MPANAMATDGTGKDITGWDTTAPTVNTSTLNGDNAYLDITFDEGIYGAGNGATALTAANMTLIFTKNSGTATNAVIGSIKKNDNAEESSATALSGGETEVRVFITITGITSGIETIEIKPLNATAIYDRAGNAMASTQTTGTKTLNDQAGPRAGGDGTITVSNVTQSSVDLSWTAATDDITAQASLQYRILSSSDDNIDTVADAETNGIIVQDWTANLTDNIVTSLTSGTKYYFNVLVKDEVGNKTAYTSVAQTTAAASSGDSDSTPQIIVNSQTAGTTTTSTEDGQTVTTVTIDSHKLEQRLEIAGNKATVVIPVSGSSDIVEGVLNGQTVKSMENKEAVLEIKTEEVTYTLPASQINIDAVWQELGKEVPLEDIKVSIRIAEPPADTVKIVEDTANKNNYQIVVKPIEFEITCTSGDKTVDVTRFSGYVERVMEIPAGVDPSKITTGIVFNADGTISHIPTEVFYENGKYYARLSSLTNSAYSVIWNPITVKSVENHWAKVPVNDMPARMVIKNPETFTPDGAITRGEFAEYITKALGLYRIQVAKAGKFADVNISNELADAITIATDYGIISGYPDGTFRPDNKISREEAMAMYSRAMDVVKLSEVDNNKIATYKDANKVSSWAYLSVKKVVSANVFNGRTVDTIAPQGTLTYAEAATAIRNMLIKSGLINP